MEGLLIANLMLDSGNMAGRKDAYPPDTSIFKEKKQYQTPSHIITHQKSSPAKTATPR